MGFFLSGLMSLRIKKDHCGPVQPSGHHDVPLNAYVPINEVTSYVRKAFVFLLEMDHDHDNGFPCVSYLIFLFFFLLFSYDLVFQNPFCDISLSLSISFLLLLLSKLSLPFLPSYNVKMYPVRF
ncbi:hypothetical protein AWENTII_001761 [Aspergillus wentii]